MNAMSLLLAIAMLLGGGTFPAYAQSKRTSAPPAEDTAHTTRDDFDLPVSLDRIRRELRRADDTATPLSDGQLRYYVEVIGKVPRFDQIFGDFDLTHGPVPHAGVTHQEFLDLVTPKEYRPYAGLTAGEAAQAAITTLVTRWLMEQARKARDKSDR